MRKSHSKHIQIIRGVSVIAVVLYHAGLNVPGGFAGVDAFFVVSGFVISKGLLKRKERTTWSHILDFLRRRILRLAPSLLVVLVFVATTSAIFLDIDLLPQINSVMQTALISVSNFALALGTGGYFDPDTAHNPLLHTWSLSVEGQFYLTILALVSTAAWFAKSCKTLNFMRVLGITTGTLAIISLTFMISNQFSLFNFVPKTLTGFYSPFSRFWEFGAGLLALFLVEHVRKSQSIYLRLCKYVSWCLLFSSFLVLSGGLPSPGTQTIVPVLATFGILVTGELLGPGLRAPKHGDILATIGDRSYSIYLWHWPFLVLGAKILGGDPLVRILSITLGLVAAELCYRKVEQRFRENSTNETARKVRFRGFVALLLISLSFSLAFFLVSVNLHPVETQKHDSFREAQIRRCTDTVLNPTECRFGSRNEPQVFLVGDSQASSLAPGIIRALSLHGYSTFLSSRSGCPYLQADTTGNKTLNCKEWQADIGKLIDTVKPKMVVIANRSSGYTNLTPSWRTLIGPRGIAARSEIGQIYSSSLLAVSNHISAQGIPFIVVKNIPESQDVRTNGSIFDRMFPQKAPSKFDAASSFKRRALASRIEDEVVGMFVKGFIFDPYKALCARTSCQFSDRGRPIYRDPIHLNAIGANILTEKFSKLLYEVEKAPMPSG